MRMTTGMEPSKKFRLITFAWISRDWLAVFEVSGEPGRTRTFNPLIKSQLLYH
jgi:hypothetical protein